MHPIRHFHQIASNARSVVRTTAFILRVMPMLPSRWLDRISHEPVHELVAIPGIDQPIPSEIYRPAHAGRHPGVVLCLGVIPFDTTHPQVERLGRALAQRGFATLIVWSADMRALRISPDDAGRLATAYDWLTLQSYVDPKRSGFLGTCVGAGFVLLAAADPRIRDRIAFVNCFAPFGSLRTLALDIGSSTTEIDGVRHPWIADQLSRHVYIRTLTAGLPTDDASRLECSWFEGKPLPDSETLGSDARIMLPLLRVTDRDELGCQIDQFRVLRENVDSVCPIDIVDDIHAPQIRIGHDRDDNVLPFGESQRLFAAFHNRPGVHLTEFHMFQHADPTKRKLGKWTLIVELAKFGRFCWPTMRMPELRSSHHDETGADGASFPPM